MKSALNIKVTGIVQGVGFRPFVYKQAKKDLITGWVRNSVEGVEIFAEGEDEMLDSFCMSLANEGPAAAKVEQIEMDEVPLQGFEKFEIKTSDDDDSVNNSTQVSPDLSVCDDCLKELFDQENRRYHYPFINCTNCGPRFTITENLPYDRKNTSMSEFDMCSACADEYENVENRRFHAQPNACFECGPQINWVEVSNDSIDKKEIIWGDNINTSDAIIDSCVDMLLNGKIVAIKGLGGYHLACDATNENAVFVLRQKKQRNDKPFAIMARDMGAIEEIAHVNDVERRILTSAARPIVLLKDKKADVLAPSVCMGLAEIGVMLAYTPVQALIFEKFQKLGGKYLVMTSGNICDEAICIDDEQAYEQLSSVADAFLGNNRKILNRYDDSVIRVLNTAGTQAISMIRRARGYAPSPLKVKIENANTDNVFAVGPEQKNTFSYLRALKNPTAKHNAEIFVSQYIGDMESVSVNNAWLDSKNYFEKTFNLRADKFAIDAHPDYLTSKWAENKSSENTKICKIQHHFAHIASVIAENSLEGAVIGFAFDGTGYGLDGNIWGGEVLLCNNKDFERFANLSYMPMPGSASAIKNPAKMAYGLLWSMDLLEHKTAKALLNDFSDDEISALETMIENGVNCPYTSSIGRLFDAVSALLLHCKSATYEGQPAIMLEALLHDYLSQHAGVEIEYDQRYDIKIVKNVGNENSTAHDTSVLLMDPVDTITAVLDDIAAGMDAGIIAKHFHDALIRCIINVSALAHQLYGVKTVALAGGVFMNRYLMENAIEDLAKSGFSVAINRELPPNDGSISFGEAFICANNK